MIDEIREISLNVPGVIATEKCHVRKMGMTFYVDLHMVVSGDISVREGHTIAHDLKNEIQKKIPEIADVLVHTEPDSEALRDRKSTRLNSSHVAISYAVFCLK